MRFWKTITVAALAIGFCTATSFAGIVGSKHDFSGTIGGGQICQPCHAPHGTMGTDINGNVKAGPLWNHTMSTATNGNYSYLMYNPSGTSKTYSNVTLDNVTMLCMSCHDGTVALDSYGGGIGGTLNVKISQAPYTYAWTTPNGVGNLTGNHPLGTGQPYPTADGKTSTSTYMNAPTNWTLTTTVGGVTTTSKAGISLQQITGQTGYYVGCTSCHNQHNGANAPYMTVLDNTVPQILDNGTRSVTGSGLCLSCHLE